MKKTIVLLIFAAILIIACTIGVSHKVIVNQYGDSDSTKTMNTTINYNDSIKHKKQIKK